LNIGARSATLSRASGRRSGARNGNPAPEFQQPGTMNVITKLVLIPLVAGALFFGFAPEALAGRDRHCDRHVTRVVYRSYPAFYHYPYYYRTWYPRPAFGFSYYSRPVYYGYSSSYRSSVEVDVQLALKRRGYYHGSVDGDVGPQTRAAIRAYQAEHGLRVTGVIDEVLLRSLRV
jgi:hypothetical protein